jgi:hypothetical protein
MTDPRSRLRLGISWAGRVTFVACTTAGVALGSVLACGQPYSATPDVTPAGDAAPDAASDGPLAPDPCVHAAPSSPPAVDDAPDIELPPFYVAVRTISLTNDPKRVVGFDLDGVCTCDTREGTAHGGQPSCTSKNVACDPEAGIDNAASALAAALTPLFPIDSVPQNIISTGRKALLIEVARYNGRRNDQDVAFGVAISDGIRVQGCPGSVKDVAKAIWSPGWCGDDPWTFLPDGVFIATKQPIVQGVGFVRDGVLTLKLETTLLLPFDEANSLPLSGVVVTGTLVPLGEDLLPRDPMRTPTDREKRLYALEGGLLGGRTKTTDLLKVIGTVNTSPAASPPSYLCQQSTFAAIRSSVCASGDVSSIPTRDFDPTAVCDALSVGVTFTAFPVLPGDVHSTTLGSNPCTPTLDAGPDGAPSSLYTCAGSP